MSIDKAKEILNSIDTTLDNDSRYVDIICELIETIEQLEKRINATSNRLDNHSLHNQNFGYSGYK